MLNFDAIRPAAKVAFGKMIREKVDYISNICWGCNLRPRLQEINEILAAASAMDVSTARTFTEDEIVELAKLLFPLRTLEMKGETRNFLLESVFALGVDRSIFEK